MKKCDFHCCCSEEMALPGKPTAFPSPVIFPWVQGDGRKVVLVPKRPVQCSGGEAFPRLFQGAAKLLPHIWGGKGGRRSRHPRRVARATAGVHRGRNQRPRGKAVPHTSPSARCVPCRQGSAPERSQVQSPLPLTQ